MNRNTGIPQYETPDPFYYPAMIRIIYCAILGGLCCNPATNCVRAQSTDKSDQATESKCRELCGIVSDKSATSIARRAALQELVGKHFKSGMDVGALSSILAQVTAIKPGDYSFVHAFAGAWPFDEAISSKGNTLVGFRVHWKEPDSMSVVYFLISGNQPDKNLTELFAGRWPPGSKSILKAAKFLKPENDVGQQQLSTPPPPK